MKLICGNKDLIEQLETALEAAKNGELVGVVIVGITSGDGIETGGNGWHGAYRDDVPFPWARLYAATAAATNDLMNEGVEHWREP